MFVVWTVGLYAFLSAAPTILSDTLAFYSNGRGTDISGATTVQSVLSFRRSMKSLYALNNTSEMANLWHAHPTLETTGLDNWLR
jgi:hypothetical protein